MDNKAFVYSFMELTKCVQGFSALQIVTKYFQKLSKITIHFNH